MIIQRQTFPNTTVLLENRKYFLKYVELLPRPKSTFFVLYVHNRPYIRVHVLLIHRYIIQLCSDW